MTKELVINNTSALRSIHKEIGRLAMVPIAWLWKIWPVSFGWRIRFPGRGKIIFPGLGYIGFAGTGKKAWPEHGNPPDPTDTIGCPRVRWPIFLRDPDLRFGGIMKWIYFKLYKPVLEWIFFRPGDFSTNYPVVIRKNRPLNLIFGW